MPPLVLFHTSPVLIEKLARHSPYSPFDGCFFFSGSVYTMGPGDPYVYTVALKPDDVIDVSYLDDWSYAKVDEGAGEAAVTKALREIEDEALLWQHPPCHAQT